MVNNLLKQICQKEYDIEILFNMYVQDTCLLLLFYLPGEIIFILRKFTGKQALPLI